MSMYSALKPVFFGLDAEKTHHRAIKLLSLLGSTAAGRAVLARTAGPRVADPVELFGLRFENRVGLAAGYDKNAKAILGLAALGFGHLEIGTVTPQPQQGNPKPRVFRLVEDESLINRLGFPSDGATVVAERLGNLRRPDDLVLGINIGKQKSTPLDRAAEDYLELFDRLAPLADYLTVNVSSPNTPELRKLELGDGLSNLLEAIAQRRAESIHRPILIKISPDLGDDALLDTADRVADAGMDGLIVSNTTVAREGLSSPNASQTGGLSGAALTERSQGAIEKVAAHLGGRLPLIGVGGLIDQSSIQKRRLGGAELVQLYTGLVYRGPALVGITARAARKK